MRTKILIKKLKLGKLKVNTYIVLDEKTKRGFVIDPGARSNEIIKIINGYKIKYIFITHGHFDHIVGNRWLKEKTGAKIAVHKDDAQMLTSAIKNFSLALFKKITSPKADIILKDGDEISVGDMKIRIISSSGHSPGAIAILVNNKYLFSGDIIFKNGYGFAQNIQVRKKMLKNIKNKLLVLPNETEVFPGHKGNTTIGAEKARYL